MRSSILSDNRLWSAVFAGILSVGVIASGVAMATPMISDAYADPEVAAVEVQPTASMSTVLADASICEGLNDVINTQAMAAQSREEARLAAEEEARQAAIAAAAAKAASSGQSYSSGGSGWLTKSGGVYYGPSGKETYYSSKKAYHYRTGEWTVGDDGVYRDSDGYVVVATPQGNMGAIVETSHGTGKVYDLNAGGDSTDLYVAW